jgi:uncharacterized 2Fe-2S/4Fe-4S cluster protein (DUF4445 family)
MSSVTFKPDNLTVAAEDGELLSLVAARAGLPLRSDCGGQGTCHKCAVVLEAGQLRTKAGESIAAGPGPEGAGVLACQSIMAGDATVRVPEESRSPDIAPFARSLGAAAERLDSSKAQGTLARRLCVSIPPPEKGDSVADLERLVDGLRSADATFRHLSPDLPTLRALPNVLRESNWHVCATIADATAETRLVDLAPARDIERPTFGLAIDIGTSTVAVALVSLETGRVVGAAGRRNRQIRFGADVISRIIWSSENEEGVQTLRRAVVETLNEVTEELKQGVKISADDIIAVTCAGNSTMVNFLLGIDCGPIRRDPHTPPASHLPLFSAGELGLDAWARAPVMCLPTVSGFVGADITAGVLATDLADSEALTVLVDVGTNGEIVVGMGGMLVCASCSAGPAFEGVGIECGMHGAPGAIDGLWYDPDTDEVNIEVIGDLPPRGICGTGFIDALATLFEGGIIDRGGHFVSGAESRRIRAGDHEPGFAVVLAGEHGAERDMVLWQSDVENLIRSKAAVHAGLSVLLQKLQFEPDQISRLYLAGAFGSHLDVRRAVTIGMLPDLPADRVQYVGNTSLAGAHMCLISQEARERIRTIASAMTYVELSVEPGFMEEYVASMFLPHTDVQRFPSVVRSTTG